MSDTASTVKTVGFHLAETFYIDHRAQFDIARAKPGIDDKHFYLTTDEFDDWLVRNKALHAPADQFDSNTAERRGATSIRNAVRTRINSAAMKSTIFSAYMIGPATNNRVKIRLIALYAKEAPGEIAHRIDATTRHYQRQIRHVVNVLKHAPEVPPEYAMPVIAFATFLDPMLRAFSDGVSAAMGRAKRNARKLPKRTQRARLKKT